MFETVNGTKNRLNTVHRSYRVSLNPLMKHSKNDFYDSILCLISNLFWDYILASASSLSMSVMIFARFDTLLVLHKLLSERGLILV